MNLLLTLMHAGWLGDLGEFLRKQVERLWDAIVLFFKDLVLFAIDQSLELVARVIEMLPVPEFLEQNSLNAMLGKAGPVVGWFVETFQVAECFAMISAAITFRMLRKILTLGKW
ncbi:phage coat protein [Stenotrophomonas sp. BIGb0135]|uniref:phage coat protein n=1 Tax=Stenotrophomonas sp. BIGb0135 TaxID=2940620 RepID=UPI00216A4D41|nr:phage coat protein [Stenotrophomonas sp. BIGb0135]MCS4233098.1 hypothetical protein [Stenotrophomonas sp. BIGb0135]